MDENSLERFHREEWPGDDHWYSEHESRLFRYSKLMVMDGSPVAYFVIIHKPFANHLSKLFVLPEYRGQGIGDLIMAHVVSMGACTLLVQPDNNPAIQLYTKYGFREVSRNPDRIKMKSPSK